jgi:hypothetical protein
VKSVDTHPLIRFDIFLNPQTHLFCYQLVGFKKSFFILMRVIV